MKETKKLKEKQTIFKITNPDYTGVYFVEDYNTYILANIANQEGVSVEVANNDKYICVWTQGNDDNPSLNVEALFDLTNKKLVTLNDDIKAKAESMFVYKIGLSRESILSIINKKYLGIATDEDINWAIDYLTNDEFVPIEGVIDYIYSCYPKLIKYSKLKKRITVEDYNNVAKELEPFFMFHSMPTILNAEEKQKRTF